MFSLLNRFAWVIATIIGLQFSFFVDRDGPFDYEGFWVFIITILIVKFSLFSGGFIKNRLEFFAESINKNYLSNSSTKKSKKETAVNTEENNFQNDDYFKAVDIKLDQEKITPKVFAEKVNEVKKIKEEQIEKIDETPSKISIAISNFFAENLLAKLGGILVFLGVLFLLSLVYTNLGPVGKLIIGFAIGFSIFIAGVLLDKNDYQNEGRILLGIGILINYLVILSGRYLIGDNIDNNILSVGTTFLFLIFNTVFAVITSLLYKSRTLLLFSFLFAFINPLLVGGSSDNPYTLVGYSLIVAFGGLYISNKSKDFLLAIGIFILANILFLLAPFGSDIHWITKLVGSAVISIASILTVYKIDVSKLSTIFIGSYVFLVLLLGSGDSYINQTTSFISYMITILLYFGIGIYYFLKTSFNSLVYILLAPILIILGLSFSGDIFSIPLTLGIIVLIYLMGFNFIQDKLPNFLKYIFFVILGIYIFLTNGLISFEHVNLDLYSYITVLIISFVFIFTSYYLSKKKGLEFLYSIGTIGGIFTLAPILLTHLPLTGIAGNNYLNQDFIKFSLSILAIFIFALSNWILPFTDKQLTGKDSNIKNLILGTITGILFIGFELFNYGIEYFPGVSLGYSFAILAIVYFILAHSMMSKLGIDKIKKEETSKNVIYSYLAISISIFSLAIALIFSNYESVISSIWLFEATILFYFFSKTKEAKIYVAAIILFIIGIFKLFNLIDVVNSKDFIFLIPFSLIFTSLVLNIKFIDFNQDIGKRIFHDILHILGISTLGILLLEIIPSTGHGWSTLGITSFLAISSIIYSYYNSKILKVFFIVGFTGFLLLQTFSLDSVIWKLDMDNLDYLIVLQYISTLILSGIVLIWNKINKAKLLNLFINSVFGIYLLVITSIYIYDIFSTTFAVTIYWGITASIILFYGIAKDKIKLRTLGLYLIALTSGKIFFYDIWYGLDDAISRVAALIILGVLFIIISTRYTKKYGNNITKELSLDNLIDSNDKKVVESNDKDSKSVNKKIKNIKTSNIKSVQFIFSDKSINIRAINLIKIVKLITEELGTTKFKKNELKDMYLNIKDNFKSDLSKANYDKIIEILEQFVKEGGEVKLIKEED